MARLRHSVAWAVAGGAATLLVVIVGLLLLSRTQAGVEAAGGYVVERVRGSVHGELEVAGIRSRGLLRSVTLDGVRITGPDGRLFLRADSARLTYDIRVLLGGDISFNRLSLYRPEIHVERLPGVEKWNYQIIFPGDPEQTEENLVLIEDLTVHDGYVAVRLPWEPTGEITPEERARLVLEQVPGGTVRTVRFTDLDVHSPRVIWQEPGAESRIIQIDRLAGRAYLWDSPAEIRQLRGTVTLRDSIITFRAPEVRLPDSELAALGQVVVGERDLRYDIEASSDRVSLRDFQWLYAGLPTEGGGGLRLRIQTQDDGSTLWLASDMRLRAAGSEVAGTFGVVTGDTLYFANVSLRASPLDIELIRQLLPVDLPVEGLLIGTVEVDGPLSSLRTRGDLRHRSLAATPPAESAVRWSGVVRAEAPYGVAGLDADIRRLDLQHVAAHVPGLRLRGIATGRVRVDGSVERGFDVTGRVALDQSGTRSAVQGGGRVLAANGRSRVDLHLDAQPVALRLFSQQYPALTGLGGEASGPVRLVGTLADLHLDADLRTTGGVLQLEGQLASTRDGPRYGTRGRMQDFRLDQLVAGIPETSVTGTFELDGGLGALRDLDGRFSVDLESGRIAGLALERGRLAGSVADGLARVDSLAVNSPVGRLQGGGTLGLVAEREGTLHFRVDGGTLGPLEPILFDVGASDDAAAAEPRVGGNVARTGMVNESLAAWQAHADATARDLVYDRLELASAVASVRWAPGGGAMEVSGDSLRAWGREVPRVLATLQYAGGSGDLRVRADGPHAQALTLDSRFRREPGALALELDTLMLRTGEGLWALHQPATARVGREGIAVHELLVRRDDGGGEIHVAGVLPWLQPEASEAEAASLAVELRGISIAEFAAMAQSEHDVTGTLAASLRVTGMAAAPRLDGVISARPFRYEGAVLDSVGGSLNYQERLLTGSLLGWRGGRAIVAADAALPIELALASRDERLLDRPLYLGLHADGLPAGLVAFLLPGLRQVEGVLDGSMRLTGVAGGTARNGDRPVLDGELRLAGGSAFVEPLNVHFRDIDLVARMGEGSLVKLEGRLRSENGSAEVRGSLDVDRPADPMFNLRIVARRLDAARRRDVTALADGELRLTGRYTRPIVGGNVRLISAEMNLDEMLRQYQVVQLDTSLLQIFDATTIAYRIRPANPFIENVMLSGLTVSADRNVWLRSQELNVEVAGDLDVALDRQFNDIRLTGTMAALRGSYQLQVLERVPTRRFEIREGTIEFAGTPGIDPNLNITAGYRIRRAQGDPLDVLATVTGTIHAPRVRLSSDSDPPVSETDIASFLLFGRSTLELSQSESDVVASMREGMLGLARPIFLGLASTQLQHAVVNLGLPLDYLALSAPEYGFGDYSQVMNAHGGLGVLQGTQLEAGAYLHPDVFVLGSFTPFARAMGAFAESEPLFHPRWGARVEWRFRPTWTAELYWEDRFARTPSFGYDQIQDRTVGGMSVFREWGY
jgi:translocation and assembly module TamB